MGSEIVRRVTYGRTTNSAMRSTRDVTLNAA